MGNNWRTNTASTFPNLFSLSEAVLQPSPLKVPASNPNFRKLGVHADAAGGINIAVVAPNATAIDFCVQLSADQAEKVVNQSSNNSQGQLSKNISGLVPTVADENSQDTEPDTLAASQIPSPQANSRYEMRWSLLGPEEGIWHGHIDGLGIGTEYGFRAFGEWNPENASYYNPAKLLLDPYGRGITGTPELSASLHGHQVDSDLYPAVYPLAESSLNSAVHACRSVVVQNQFDVVPGPNSPWQETVIYELHVKGFTKNLPGVPPELQGTYAGLAHPASIKHLKNLGITAVELLPIHAKMDEPFLTERGLTNYWGYSTLSFFSPEPSYATKQAQSQGAGAINDEFRGMVSLLHEANIEVLLDVVYNHTCEGGDTGVSVCWRGLDSQMYYRHTSEKPRVSIDDTGCGNTLDFSEQRVVQMTLDSLRYWTEEMGIDGFRFDLAVTLGRLDDGYTNYHPFLSALGSDSAFRNIKMIAEPWDLGPGGWQTGNFPLPFSEWNDRYRDSLRTFWLTDFQNEIAGRGGNGPYDLATRLSGSADLFSHSPMLPRGPRASINFIAAHDGFTLADLTAYEHKHNMANLENNQDGSSNNLSWNHGIEGVPGGDDNEMADSTGIIEDILFARERSRRNLLSTLMISAGTPMIVAGDEFGRSQYGNNNAYCQDSPISWIDWNLGKEQQQLLNTVQYLLELRRIHPVMRPSKFMTGQTKIGDSLPDVSWFTATGDPIPAEAWAQPSSRVFQMRRSGKPMNDTDLLAIFNGTLDTASVVLPAGRETGKPTKWALVNDTSWMRPKTGRINGGNTAIEDALSFAAHSSVQMEPQSMQIYLAK